MEIRTSFQQVDEKKAAYEGGDNPHRNLQGRKDSARQGISQEQEDSAGPEGMENQPPVLRTHDQTEGMGYHQTHKADYTRDRHAGRGHEGTRSEEHTSEL